MRVIWLLIGVILGCVVSSVIYLNLFISKCIPTKIIIYNQSSFSDNQQIIVRHIPIVAVNTFENEGIVGNLTLKLVPGNNNILIDTNPFSEPEVQYAANIAVSVARMLSKNYENKDFIFSFNIPAEVVGGSSAGAAMTIVAYATLTNKHLKPGVVITGTITHDGKIGKVSAILEKAKAVADSNYKIFLVPKGQTKLTYYEKETKGYVGFGFSLYNIIYRPKKVDIKDAVKEEWNLEMIEVSNIEEALKYFVK